MAPPARRRWPRQALALRVLAEQLKHGEARPVDLFHVRRGGMRRFPATKARLSHLK